MNENEILEHMALHGDRVWSNLQFWTSVSFGLLIAAHIAAANVSKSVLAAILVLYMFFTATFMGMVLYDIEVIRAGGMQLKMLADAGPVGQSLKVIGIKNARSTVFNNFS